MGKISPHKRRLLTGTVAIKPVGLPVGFWVDNCFGPGQRITEIKIIWISATVDIWRSGQDVAEQN